ALDLDGDGLQDLVTVLGSGGPSVAFWHSLGDGTFAPSGSLAVAGLQVAASDFNGDGFTDLAVTTPGTQIPPQPSSVSIFLGNGDSTFQAPVRYTIGGPNATDLALGDFNGDGTLDLAVLTVVAVTTLPGNGDGTFGGPIQRFSGRLAQHL